MTDSLLLSTGEFARMCCVSRELLVHYDKIGLLKPKKVEGSGYRYYSLRQLYLFDVIRFFIDTGMSTKEVRDYLENRSTDLFLDTIQESIDALGRQRDLLTARIGMTLRNASRHDGPAPSARLSQRATAWRPYPARCLRRPFRPRTCRSGRPQTRKPPHRRMRRVRKEGAAR